jgi:transcriptional regulator with PAS, ATPase and Fis domain
MPPADRVEPRLPEDMASCEATLREVEDWYIHRVLAHEGHNYAAAARRLGIDRSTVKRRTEKENR